MSIELKQSTSVTLKIGPFIDDTDGKTAETGLTIAQADVRLSKNGGNIAQKNEATSCTHDELGIYGCPLDATDTGTLGILRLDVQESGALPVFHYFSVITANAYDSKYSTDKLEVDIKQIGGVEQSATDLKDFADTGYNPSTHKVAGVLLTDTCTTLTGHTAQTGDGYAVVNHADHGNAKLVRSTTPANKLDVSATGEAGLDFANIKDATGAHTLTNITVPTTTDVTNDVTSVFAATLDLTTNMKSSVNTEADTAISDASLATSSALSTVDGVVDDILVDTNEIQGALPTNYIMGSSDVANHDSDLAGTIIDASNTELASIPTTTGSLRTMIQLIFQWIRNAKTVTSTTESLKKEDGSTQLGSAALSDDGTTFTKGELS